MYYLSVMAIFKNETLNLNTWIQHYLWQGVDHFYLIDNGSDDNPLSILNSYIEQDIVSYYHKTEKHQQVNHYKSVFDMENLKRRTHWLIICDLDEFFYGVDNKLRNKINCLEYYNVIYCNWLMFGSNNFINHPPDIRTALTKREPEFHYNTKYIFKPKCIESSNQISIHNLHYYDNNKIRIANQLIRLNHYPIQSVEFFQKVKMTRGDALNNNDENFRDMNYFERYNINTTYEDTILKDLVLNYS